MGRAPLREAATGTTELAGASRPAGTILSILRQLCPNCRQARVFRGLISMRESCAECGWRFEREPGYFVAAMYLSYALAVPTYALLVVLIEALFPGRSVFFVLGAALPLFLPLAPILFRYSRILWMHLDRTIDPPE